MNEDLSLPFEVLPARPRRRKLGMLVLVISGIGLLLSFLMIYFVNKKYGSDVIFTIEIGRAHV